MVKNLGNLCLDVVYDYAKTITNRISKSGRELTGEQRVQLITLHHVMKVLKLWDLPNFIQRYKNDYAIWNIRVQDISNPDFVTLTLRLESPAEFEKFKAFLRHLISNWFRNIKVRKLDNGQLSFVVTHPAPALLHIFPQDRTNLDEHFKFSTLRSSHVETFRPAVGQYVAIKLVLHVAAMSKFQPTDADEDGQWLCSHYKRRCYVKFECCNKFWPCHRCHNNQSTCVRRKLKSRDTKQIKCFACGQEQPFAHHCSKCNAKFARYFCGQCKHLTGTDDNPYHCEKCGICRIHGDRSFHCDVCGVCLDIQLRGNHKCRAGSAQDECCICLEDAFTGCQILPCSHKVHKECATQMIRSGITRCPICRESFEHKLERRPHPSKKPPGKQ
ncbi:RING finger and CHY zinc finger domain-containing 1-like [Paramuricea clavata]|uniref:RING finger and CHY zinc finger domain-containing 1-like n=1 Tax=Paramuricea clavata TaxID=317549 RepID=A0A7D9HRR3_PARCT|nr:RING finger and CHY zinc finger domain-containing 1-like [Paramuricea clavata]